jgi:hypothetical protein
MNRAATNFVNGNPLKKTAARLDTLAKNQNSNSKGINK